MKINTTPLYNHPAAYAREHGELELYRTSRQANMACKAAMERAIAEHYRDNILCENAVKQVIAEFGYDRTFYILANTVQQKDQDGRFSCENKAWAKAVPIPEDRNAWGENRLLDLVVDQHPGLVNLFLDQTRSLYREQARPSIAAQLQQPAPAPKQAASKKHDERER